MRYKPMRRMLAGFLAGMMCLSMMPVSALADDSAAGTISAAEAATPETALEQATPETAALGTEAQAFIDAVNALDREAILSAVRRWAIASAAWQADSDNAALEEALNQAIESSDAAAAPVYQAEDLYYAIPKEEQQDEKVQSAYASLAALVAAMQLAMENPTDTGSGDPPDLAEITEMLYGDLPDAPTGSYIGSMGLPIATGPTHISISEWVTDLYDGQDAHLDAEALHADDLVITVGREPGEDYAIVPLLTQVEYPANGSSSEVILPDDVVLLDFEGQPADTDEIASITKASYTETSAYASGFYVKAEQDFSIQLIYHAPDGNDLSKTLQVKLGESKGESPAAATLATASTYAAGPTPPFTTGKITSISFEGGTWLVWFNGREAYCCSHGLNGQPTGCPTYSFAYTSKLEPGQYTPGNHYANQINIWGGLNQLSLNLLEEKHSGTSAVTYGLDDASAAATAYRYYDDVQLWVMENYPNSVAAQAYRASAQALAEQGTDNRISTYSGENGYYTYIYNPPAGYAWQVIAIVGEEIPAEGGGTEIPDIPDAEYYSANWSAPAQSANGSFDLTFTVNTDKIGLETGEKVDGAKITITPSQTSGSVDGGSWQMSPAGAQTLTTSGHTQDDNYQNNGGDGTVSWTVHYSVSKTSTSSLSGQEGPYASQAEANAAAEAAKNAAISQLQNEAQSMVDAAIAAARSELSSIRFSYNEVEIPYGFESYDGSLGSHQTITVPADSSNTYVMRNDEWSLQVDISKIDSETGNVIAADSQFAVFEWDTVAQMYIPNGGYNQYTVVRNSDGSYSVANNSSYAASAPANRTLYYTQRNEGRFLLVETRAPEGYYGDWSDNTTPGTAGHVEGKRAYAFSITRENDGSVIHLSNRDYNANIGTENAGGTLLRTPEGKVVSLTLYDQTQDATHTYTTDSTGFANNEDTYTSVPVDYKFTNDRVIGEIVLTKADLDQATEGADTASHGAASIEGAVYDLYAAEDIQHPDGVSGTVDYSKIVDASGSPIWHTTVLTNGGWDNSYLPVLAKDHLVASAEIQNGVLAFANLYLGRYYLVERATGIVVPVDTDGHFYLTGQYPELDRTLQPAGSYLPLATDDSGAYTDYVYRNQYSAVAVSRALSGVKTYDGYYLSFAEGYLCDEINHYSTLAYGSESQYITRGEDLSEDAVLKSGFELRKVVSTTGPNSPAVKLEGAGFTVYRIWELSKVSEFKQNADGSYDVQSILDAYRKDNYDNNTAKYDFSGESQAVARMYESDSAVVAEYNASLTAAHDYANGQGDGWVSTGAPNEYRLSEIFTNEEGVLRINGLPYGQYLIVESTLPKDLFQADPFIVTVNASAPQSVFCQPDGSVTTASNSYMAYSVLDEELEGYLQLIKIDAETGKPVKIADTAFQIYKIAEDGTETLVEMNDSGDATAKTTTFYTDADGYLKTSEKLPLGRYRIVEVEGPEGFFNDTAYNVVFELTSERVWEVVGGSADDMDDYILTEEYSNHETLGQLTIRKIGNLLAGYKDGQFLYEQANLADAVYEIRAHGDIATGDRQGTLWYADGDLVATVTTGREGQVDEVKFSPTRTQATYDFLTVSHDGTTGEVTITLPLGSYDITEVQAPYGFVHTDQTYTVTFGWDNQYNDIVLAQTIVDHTQNGDEVYSYDILNASDATGDQLTGQPGTIQFENARVIPVVEEGRIGVGVYKLDRDSAGMTDDHPYVDGVKSDTALLAGGSNRDRIPEGAILVPGATYELYTADDIYSMDGTLLASADTLLATATTGEDGLAYFNVDVPIRGEHYGSSDAHDWTTNSGRYYIREISVPDGYLIEQSVIPVEFTYENQLIAWQVVDCLHSNKQTEVDIDKQAFATLDPEATFALPGATLTITDWDGNVVDSWETGDTNHIVRGLHLNQSYAPDYNQDLGKVYTLTETRPADGYTTARSIQFYLKQAAVDGAYVQETELWLREIVPTVEYQSGSILSPITFVDEDPDLLHRVFQAFVAFFTGSSAEDGKTQDGVVIADWVCVNNTLLVTFTDDATEAAIAKCLHERDFAGLTFDQVYLMNGSAPAFFADMQVSEKPAGTDIVYNGDWHKADGTTITMVDAPTRIKISKVDITTSDEVEGAEMQIVDSNGTVVESWTSGPEPHYIEATLIAGATYTLVEAKAPTQDGYVPAASIQFTVEDDGKVQHVFMQDDYTKVSISKTDIATGAEVPGAHLQIVDGEGNVLAEWVTDGQPHYIERLPVGNLVLIETMAPAENGYVRAENVSFTVQPTGEIQRVEMKDDFTKVEISKKDITNGDELRGAHLRITDEEGSVVAEWVSDGQPRRIDRLQPGIYTLTETAAPASYQLAESIRFQVEESGRIQKVTMYDAPVGTFTITKMDEATNTALPGARLSLRDSDGYVIDSWYTNTAPHALPVLTEDKAARDPRTHLLLFSTDSVEHVYTLVEEAVPTGYLTADSITFKLMQMDGKLTLFVKTDGAWQKADEAVLKMFDARNPDVPVPDLHKNFPQTGSSTQ
ncbi:SpaA isopeptide-forming pilin-related protein [uncultured Subdoligranulum sp.]|uniref:SpaA isopeptide-forming pilin-related protein n=1 Tax=uncultured Subdoligranulum sp. TaxID=512298 RepID=UPI00260A284E|nr:SpaA isopeptide-forming pilin-related protein [uncultured Subdoligranulum sp.]